MKISYNWLKTLINLDIPAEETAELLTASGLEVEGLEKYQSVAGGLEGLVVGEVLECGKHPGADRLSITKVDVGNGAPLSIVCGASNVASGQKVIVATPGTRLYPSNGEPFEIKRSKIRGELSEGMICAEDEIGLGTSHEGIMVLPQETKTGTRASDYFKIENDTILEIGLTPNRSDAASHLGVARDLVSVLNTSKHSSEHKLTISGTDELPESDHSGKISIEIKDPAACKRYSAMMIKGITVSESPGWLKNRLRSIGLRPINNIVDITNFVLHELGQPLHAFDAAKIKGQSVVVRRAKEGEKFTTLDTVSRTLKDHDLVICDDKDVLCIAGVFGGLSSGVTETTTEIFLESAYFDPSSVRRTSKYHSLKTDASFRFERGTDPEMTVTALVRAANLVLQIAGGEVSMAITDKYPEKLLPFKVAFSYSNCTELIGKEIDRPVIKNIIINLGIEIESEGSDGLLLLVPRYKTDVIRETDVIEEVMRIYGYNKVDVSRHISYTSFNDEKNSDITLEQKTGTMLENSGFTEIMGLSLTSSKYYNGGQLVKVLNPLSSDLDVMRADMVYGGLEAIAYNCNRKNNDLKFFEFGRTYSRSEEKYQEEKFLSIYVTGRLFKENPYGLQQKANMAYMRSIVENLLLKSGVTGYKISSASHADLEFGLSYQLKNNTIVELGLVKKELLDKCDVSQDVIYASISWRELQKTFEKNSITFSEISRFPSVRRDLALLIDKSIKYQQIEDLAFATEKKLLTEVNLFDIYESEKLGNKRSYAVSFTLLDREATLTEKQIDGVMDKLIKGYKEKLGAELR